MARRANRAVEIKPLPQSRLGADNHVLEQTREGAPAAVAGDNGRLANCVHEFGVLRLTFGKAWG